MTKKAFLTVVAVSVLSSGIVIAANSFPSSPLGRPQLALVSEAVHRKNAEVAFPKNSHKRQRGIGVFLNNANLREYSMLR